MNLVESSVIDLIASSKTIGTETYKFTWFFEPDLQQLEEILYTCMSVPIDVHLELCLQKNN